MIFKKVVGRSCFIATSFKILLNVLVLLQFVFSRLVSSLLQCAKLMQLLQTTEKKAEQQAEQVWLV